MIKRGERGAMLATRGGITEFPAYRVEVQDTTCAGDSFAAGFLLGISRGWPLDESLSWPMPPARCVPLRLSHRGITSLEDLLQLIKTQPSSPTLNRQLSPSDQS